MTQKSTVKKPAKKQLDAVRAALLREQDNEVNRAWGVRRALEQVEPELWAAVAGAIASDAPEGLTRHWLVTLGAEGDRTASAHAIAEAAAAVNGGRAFVTELLTGAAPFVVDDALLLRAIQNLLIGRPFAPMFLYRGAAIAKSREPALATVLEERAAFTERHAAMLADLRPGAQEKKQKAATEGLAKLKGADRSAMVTWVLTEPGIDGDTKRWARLAGFADPAVDLVTITWALNEGSGIYDEEEKQLNAIFTAGGPALVERATDMVVYAIDKQLVTAMEHLAEAAPKAFGTPRGFAAVEQALASNGPTAKRICDDMRVLSAVGKAFDDAQAERIVEVLLACDPTELEHELHRGFFYLHHAGAVPACARAFDGELSPYLVKQVIDCVAHAPGPAAQDLLISRCWVQQTNTRDLVFALHDTIVKTRHADLLAALERRPSIHAAWFLVGANMHWNHRPRAVLDIVERVLAWPSQADVDPRKLAMIYDHAVDAALELHRHELGLRALEALEALGDVAPLDPTDLTKTKSVLDAPKRALAAKLKTGELAVEAARLREEIAAARAAGTPIRADDERIGKVGGCKVHARIHDDKTTGEVWFIDREGQYGYYDGYDSAPVDWWRCVHDEKYAATSRRLADFAAGWKVEDRTLCITPGNYREITRSGAKLFGKINRSADPRIDAHTFAITLPSVERAKEVFASFATTPMLHAKLGDPFYVQGKRDGGAVVRTVHGEAKKMMWRLGRELHRVEYKWQGGATMHATDEESLAAFDAIESELLANGRFSWLLGIDGDLRPLSEMPLAKWLDDRVRDDNKPASWHLAALPEIRDALALSQIPIGDLEISLDGPASDADLAAYDATLTTPMPDALREMWRGHASNGWKLGKEGERVLSPSELLGSRKQLRDKLKTNMTKIAPKRVAEFPFDHVDILAVDREGNPTIAFDTRQQRDNCYQDVSPPSLKHGDWYDSLPWMIAVGPNRSLEKALLAKHPILKKLHYGQPATGGKPAKPVAAKPVAKPVTKSKAAATPAKKKSAKAKK